MNVKVLVVATVVVLLGASVGAFVLMNDGDENEDNKKGFYSWNPTVVEVNGDYSNCTPAFMSIAETVYEAAYGEIPSFDGISLEDIPEEYVYAYDKYYVTNSDGTVTVKTFDNTSTGTSGAYADKVIDFKPTKIIAYTDAYVDTLYMILCDFYGEKAHSDNSSQAESKLWELIPAMTASVKSGLESKYGLSVPSSVKIIGSGQEDLVNCCNELDNEKVIVFMSEYNIRSTNKSSWWNTNSQIEANSSGNIRFVYLLSNSPAMVLSTIEMMGIVSGFDNTESMMTSILAEIYVMQKAIDEKGGESITFYVETASAKSVGSNTLMGGIFASILKMKNVYDGSLMGSSISDEQIILAEPDVIGFYSSDARSMDERMRAL